ncbi:hypothetical protein BGZ68_008641 [Mortierella alpina]|nr:hypothetical protein BGZ68_008641 [Mortierella alpina]
MMGSLWGFLRDINPYPAKDDIDIDEDGFCDYIVAPLDRSTGMDGTDDAHRGSFDTESDDGYEDSDDNEGSSSGDLDSNSDDLSSRSGDLESESDEEDSISGDLDSEIDAEDSSSDDDRRRNAIPRMAGRQLVPRATNRNNPRQRAVLRAIDSRLGQLNHLRIMNTSLCDFRVRIKDDLGLVLSGMQQNLVEWKLNLVARYRMFESELMFFGKHFGCGRDSRTGENTPQERLEINTRKAQLQTLVLDVAVVRSINPAVASCTDRQGFTLKIQRSNVW